jgi:hypothetical protein
MRVETVSGSQAEALVRCKAHGYLKEEEVKHKE